MTIDSFDCRTGGSFRYSMESDGNEFGFYGSFHEVRPAELIVQTFTYEGVPDGVALERLVFERIGDGRTRLTSTSLVDSFEGRDAFVASGMDEGVHALGLAGIMVGATVTNLVILDVSPALTLALLLACGIVVWFRRAQISASVSRVRRLRPTAPERRTS
jgi:hypothetical protein